MQRSVDHQFERIRMSRWMTPRYFQYYCVVSGVLCSLLFLIAFAASGFIPPPKAHWSAEHIVQHYRDHEHGVQAGSAILVCSGMFYLPLVTAISAQMRRIPNLPYAVSALQLASGAAGIFTFIMPGIILGATNYRLDRPVEITYAMNELFWMTALMPWPTFMAQNFAFSFSILYDSRPKPLFPKYICFVNIITPILFMPAIAIHTATRGPLAWSGALTFWVPGSTFCLQVVIDSLCLLRAIRIEAAELGERVGEKDIDRFSSADEGLQGIEGSKAQEHV